MSAFLSLKQLLSVRTQLYVFVLGVADSWLILFHVAQVVVPHMDTYRMESASVSLLVPRVVLVVLVG